MNNYTAIIVKNDKWYAGFVKEVPGAHSQGKTIQEVEKNLKEAVKLVIESNEQYNGCHNWLAIQKINNIIMAPANWDDPMKILNYRILLRKEPEGGYTVIVPSLPGCVTFGSTIDEAIAMAKEAIELFLESLRAHGEDIPTEEKTLEYTLAVESYA